MQSTIEFLLKVTVCWSCCLLWYHFLLRGQAKLKANRFFLLFTLFIMPFLFFLPAYTLVEEVYTYNLTGIMVKDGANLLALPIERNWSFWANLLLVGAAIGLTRFLIGLIKLWHLFALCKQQVFEGTKLLRMPDSSDCYTFFGYVVVGTEIEEEDLACIVHHELAHQRLRHSYDLLLSELYTILFWFHPLVYLYKFFLRELHEYQADHIVLEKYPMQRYGDLLLQRAMNTRVSLLHNFSNYSQLKNRFKMMSNKQKNNRQNWRYAMILPVLVAILVSFNTQTVRAQVVEEPDEMPTYGTCQTETADDLKQCSMTNLVTAIVGELKYPKSAEAANKEGKVVVEFVVSKNGKVESAKILKSIDTECDAEALRVINGLKGWNAGKKDGKKVAVKMVIPIAFKLS